MDYIKDVKRLQFEQKIKNLQGYFEDLTFTRSHPVNPIGFLITWVQMLSHDEHCYNFFSQRVL